MPNMKMFPRSYFPSLYNLATLKFHVLSLFEFGIFVDHTDFRL